MPKLLADTIVNIADVTEEKLAGNSKYNGSKYNGNKYNGNQGNGGNRGGAIGTDNVIKVRIPAEGDEKEILSELSEIFGGFRGRVPVLIYLQNGKIVRTGPNGGVSGSIEFFDAVAEIVGRMNIKGRVIQ